MAFDIDDWVRRWSPGLGPTKGDDVAAIYTATGERWDVSIDLRSTGSTEIAAFAQAYLDAIPDAVCTVRSAVRDGDNLAIEWTFAGTHTGDMEGWPARGEAINLIGSSFVRVDGDRIATERVYWDQKMLYEAGPA